MKINEECYKSVEKYLDPDNPAFHKKVYYRWIEDNFGEKQVEACVEEVERIKKHAKGVERGVYDTYPSLRWGGKKIKPPSNSPAPTRVKIRNSKAPIKPFITKRQHNYEFDRWESLLNSKKAQKTKYDAIIEKIIEQEKKR